MWEKPKIKKERKTMFCPNCNSPMNNNCCPSCGTVVTPSEPVVKQKPKSKMLAILLYYLGVGNLYLGYYGRFFEMWWKGLCSFGILTVVIYFSDLFGVITGRINCDAKGVPLK